MKEYNRRVKILEDISYGKDRRVKQQKEVSSGYLRNSMEKTKRNFSNETYYKKQVGDSEINKMEFGQIYKQKYALKRNTDINRSSQSEFEIADTKNKRENGGLSRLNFLQERGTPKQADSQFKLSERKFLTNRSRNQMSKRETTQIDERSTSQKKDKSPRATINKRVLKYSGLETAKSKIMRQSTEKQIDKNVTTTELESQQSKPVTKKKEYSQQNDQYRKELLARINNNRFNLSEKQIEIFGDRFVEKFQKIKLLGRGGFSLVWLGAHRKTRQMIAVKQILTKNTHQTHLKEIWFGNFFFELGGEPREQFAYHSGITNLVKMVSYDIQHIDTWIFYELCDQTLGSALYELRGQNLNANQKVYKMTYQPLYGAYRKDSQNLKKLIIEMSKCLCLLAQHNIVHSDIKTENILLKRISLEQFQYKLTDYGSSFLFSNLKQFSMATPEYMAPEILNFILFQNELEYDLQMLKLIKDYKNESAIDIWSLGSIILQIINGVPLWMSINTRIDYGRVQKEQKVKKQENKYQQQCEENYHVGLFAVKGRLFDKIVKKQIQTVLMMDNILTKQNYSGITVDEELTFLIKRMLQLDPEKRIKPKQILTYLGVQINSDKNYFGL